MRDRVGIRDRRAAGGSIRGIAREIGASRNAVRRALAPDGRDRYHRASLAEQFEPAVRDVLIDYPLLTVQDVGQLVGWPGSRRQLSNLVAALRPHAIERSQEVYPAAVVGTMVLGEMVVGEMVVGAMHVGTMRVGVTTI